MFGVECIGHPGLSSVQESGEQVTAPETAASNRGATVAVVSDGDALVDVEIKRLNVAHGGV